MATLRRPGGQPIRREGVLGSGLFGRGGHPFLSCGRGQQPQQRLEGGPPIVLGYARHLVPGAAAKAGAGWAGSAGRALTPRGARRPGRPGRPGSGSRSSGCLGGALGMRWARLVPPPVGGSWEPPHFTTRRRQRSKCSS